LVFSYVPVGISLLFQLKFSIYLPSFFRSISHFSFFSLPLFVILSPGDIDRFSPPFGVREGRTVPVLSNILHPRMFQLIFFIGRMTLADDVDLEEHIMGKVRISCCVGNPTWTYLTADG
jgi:hypothetical protein